MTNGTLPELRRGLRNQDRVQRLLSNRVREQNTPQEMRQRVAEKNHRARQLSMLQMPEIIQSTSHSFKSGGSGVACLRTSQENEGLESSAPLGFTQRRINMRSTTNILPHDRTRYSGKIKKQMLYHGLSCLAVIFGILLASPTIAAAPQPDVRKLVTEHLSDLQEQWTANEKNYLEEQKRIHDLAEKARKTLCGVGDLSKCKNKILVDVTSYNPVEAQTDSTPCEGAGGNVCESFARGDNPIALSQDLIKTLGGGPFRMGDKVSMEGGNCTGTFTVLDTMNSRWTNRVDIFRPKRDQNVGCKNVTLVRL